MDEKEVGQFLLDSDGGGKEVDEEVRRAKGWTSGVPNFTIQEKYVVEGAQDPEEFYQLFSQIAEEKSW